MVWFIGISSPTEGATATVALLFASLINFGRYLKAVLTRPQHQVYSAGTSEGQFCS
jgi:hypothetical protein